MDTLRSKYPSPSTFNRSPKNRMLLALNAHGILKQCTDDFMQLPNPPRKSSHGRWNDVTKGEKLDAVQEELRHKHSIHMVYQPIDMIRLWFIGRGLIGL